MHKHPYVHTIARKFREESGNCFLYGCVTLVILGILGGLISFIVFRNFARQVRDKYTEITAATLPTSGLSATDAQALIARVDDYTAKLRAGEPLGTLTLTQDELNALLQNHPDVKEDFGDKVYFTLGDSDATGQMSISLDWLPMFSGRYFNGTATFEFEVSGGRVELYLTGATVKGEPVPDEFIVTVRSENLAADWLRNDPDARALVDKIDTIKIQAGTVVITPKNLVEPVLAPIGDTPAETPAPSEDAPAEAAEAAEPAEAAPPAN